MKPDKITRISNRVERELAKKGQELATPVHNEIKALIKKLQAKFPITGLIMGNGTYFLEGGQFAATFSDDSKGELPINELFDCLEGRKIWTPDALTATTERQLRELQDLLDYLTDARYLPLLDI